MDIAERIMAGTASLSYTRKPVFHLSISFAPGDAVDEALMKRVMARTLSDLGLGEHQAVIMAHIDTDDPHVHAMVNRVHPEMCGMERELEPVARRGQPSPAGAGRGPAGCARLARSRAGAPGAETTAAACACGPGVPARGAGARRPGAGAGTVLVRSGGGPGGVRTVRARERAGDVRHGRTAAGEGLRGGAAVLPRQPGEAARPVLGLQRARGRRQRDIRA